MRKGTKKYRKATSMEDAFQLCLAAAEKRRRTPKVLAELMGVALSTFYRWLSDCSMPANLIRQFEEFCGAGYISEYLCASSGERIVIEIPAGRSATVEDLAAVQQHAADALAMLSRFYLRQSTAEDTVAAISITLSDMAYQRQNVIKHAEPELGFFGE